MHVKAPGFDCHLGGSQVIDRPHNRHAYIPQGLGTYDLPWLSVVRFPALAMAARLAHVLWEVGERYQRRGVLSTPVREQVANLQHRNHVTARSRRHHQPRQEHHPLAQHFLRRHRQAHCRQFASARGQPESSIDPARSPRGCSVCAPWRGTASSEEPHPPSPDKPASRPGMHCTW